VYSSRLVPGLANMSMCQLLRPETKASCPLPIEQCKCKMRTKHCFRRNKAASGTYQLSFAIDVFSIFLRRDHERACLRLPQERFTSASHITHAFVGAIQRANLLRAAAPLSASTSASSNAVENNGQEFDVTEIISSLIVEDSTNNTPK